jgi:hypothetical protein
MAMESFKVSQSCGELSLSLSLSNFSDGAVHILGNMVPV